MEHSPYTLKETIYTESIQLICLVDEQATETFIAEMTDLLNGQLTIEKGATSYHELPFNEKEHKQMTFEEVLPQIKAGKKPYVKAGAVLNFLLNYVMKLAPPKVNFTSYPVFFNQNF